MGVVAKKMIVFGHWIFKSKRATGIRIHQSFAPWGMSKNAAVSTQSRAPYGVISPLLPRRIPRVTVES